MSRFVKKVLYPVSFRFYVSNLGAAAHAQSQVD